MRLNPEKLRQITGLKQPAAQERWFRDHFGADLPRDRFGPILTNEAFEEMVKAKAGVRGRPERPRVKVRP